MPEKKTIQRARRDKREGKAPSTQAGEFVHEEIEHVREGKHGARSAKQAIAIGLSKARRAGVDLPAPKKSGKRSTTKRATHEPSATRSRATRKALEHEGSSAASTRSLSRHAKSAARKRSPAARKTAAKKAARTRARHSS